MEVDPACTGKIGYATRALARLVIEKRKNRPSRGRRCAPYRCKRCGEWHLGTENKLK